MPAMFVTGRRVPPAVGLATVLLAGGPAAAATAAEDGVITVELATGERRPPEFLCVIAEDIDSAVDVEVARGCVSGGACDAATGQTLKALESLQASPSRGEGCSAIAGDLCAPTIPKSNKKIACARNTFRHATGKVAVVQTKFQPQSGDDLNEPVVTSVGLDGAVGTITLKDAKDRVPKLKVIAGNVGGTYVRGLTSDSREARVRVPLFDLCETVRISVPPREPIVGPGQEQPTVSVVVKGISDEEMSCEPTLGSAGEFHLTLPTGRARDSVLDLEIATDKNVLAKAAVRLDPAAGKTTARAQLSELTFQWQRACGYTNFCPAIRLPEAAGVCVEEPTTGPCKYTCTADPGAVLPLPLHIVLVGRGSEIWHARVRRVAQTVRVEPPEDVRTVHVDFSEWFGQHATRLAAPGDRIHEVLITGPTGSQAVTPSPDGSPSVTLPGARCDASITGRVVGDRTYRVEQLEVVDGRVTVDHPRKHARSWRLTAEAAYVMMFPVATRVPDPPPSGRRPDTRSLFTNGAVTAALSWEPFWLRLNSPLAPTMRFELPRITFIPGIKEYVPQGVPDEAVRQPGEAPYGRLLVETLGAMRVHDYVELDHRFGIGVGFALFQRTQDRLHVVDGPLGSWGIGAYTYPIQRGGWRQFALGLSFGVLGPERIRWFRASDVSSGTETIELRQWYLTLNVGVRARF